MPASFDARGGPLPGAAAPPSNGARKMTRENTKRIYVGKVPIGGGAPIAVQSMCTARTADAGAVLLEIQGLHAAGCDIVRVAVPDHEAAEALKRICKASPIPVVADIHFDYRLALAAVEYGAGKIRINPGNIGGAERVRAVAEACRARGVPIRIGVNSGSLEKPLLEKYGGPTAEAMAESAARHVGMLEEFGFSDICLSLKASSVPLTVAACRLAAAMFPYPLHLGVTEAGTLFAGTVSSAVGIGALLMEGIGDTIRVSLTANPIEEVRAGIEILRAAGLRKGGARLISCPTCARTSIPLIELANEVEGRLKSIDRDITVAVMGCEVNGPGEAREADYGIAGGKGEGILFKKGEIVGRARDTELADALITLIESENSQ